MRKSIRVKVNSLKDILIIFLRTKGIGNFVRQVYLRAARLFPEGTRKDFNYDRIRKHLNSKFTQEEMNIILQEKERRLVNKKYIENLKQQFQYQKSKYKRKARRLRKVEALLLRGMGCSYNRIADELGMHPVTVKELITDQRLRVKKETEYLKNVLNVIVRSIEEKKEKNNMKQPVENILKELTKDELYDCLW